MSSNKKINDIQYKKQIAYAKLLAHGNVNLNDGDILEESEQSQLQPEDFKSIINNGLRILISFVSTFSLTKLIDVGQDVEITILIFVIYCIWFTIDGNVRVYLKLIWSFQKNTIYYKTLISLINLISNLGIFLLFQFLLTIISNIWNQSNINFAEAVVSLTTILSCCFAVYHTYDSLTTN
jgi:hypothetical protein